MFRTGKRHPIGDHFREDTEQEFLRLFLFYFQELVGLIPLADDRIQHQDRDAAQDDEAGSMMNHIVDLLEIDHLTTIQSFVRTLYVAQRHIVNCHSLTEKVKEMSKQDLPVEEGVPAGLTPLREPTLFILLTLSKERKHGYAILKDVEALSEGRIVLSTGTLYGALARLLEQGLIRKSGEDNGSSFSNNRSGSVDTRQT